MNGGTTYVTQHFHENLFDDWFDDAFEKNFFGERNPLYGKRAKNLMKTDVRETDNAYEVDIDRPASRKRRSRWSCRMDT